MAFSKLPFIIAMLLLIIFNLYIILVNIRFGLFEMFFEHFAPSTMWRSLLHNMHFFFITYLRFDGSDSHTIWTTRLGFLSFLHNNHHFSSHSPTRGCSCIIYFYFIWYLRFYLSNHHTTWTIHLGLFTLSPTTIIFVLFTPSGMLLHSAHLCFIVYLRSYGSDPHHLSSFDHLSWFVHPSPNILPTYILVLFLPPGVLQFPLLASVLSLCPIFDVF